MPTPRARFARSMTIWLGLLAILMFWVIVPVVGNNALFEWIRVGMIAFSGVAVVSRVPSFYRVWKQDTETSAQQLVFGDTLLLLGICGTASWLLLWRLVGRPAWMLESALNGFWLWVLAVGAFFVLAAPRNYEYEPPRTHWLRISIAAILALVMGLVLIVYCPDLEPLAAWLRTSMGY